MINPLLLILLLSISAIIGDTVNFKISQYFGNQLKKSKWQKFTICNKQLIFLVDMVIVLSF